MTRVMCCEVCGWRRPAYLAPGPCQGCGHDGTPDSVVIDGWDAANAGVLVTALTWSAPILGSVVLDHPWLGWSLGGLMGAHVTGKAVAGLPSARLVLSDAGVALLRRRRPRRLVRWHLFDEARLEAMSDPVERGDESATIWKLVLVNAYKPTISSYLHRRGTDADIFTPCVEFVFPASPADADALRQRAERCIAAARRTYRALRLGDLDEQPLDARALLTLECCPRCDSLLGPDRVTPRCSSCGERYEPQSFVVAGAVTTPAWRGPLVAMLSLLVAPVLVLTGEPAAGAALAAAGVVVAASTCRRRARPRVTVLRDGLTLQSPEGGTQTLSFAELPVLRVVRLRSGDWRLAAWRDRPDWTAYSSLLFCWLSLPPTSPAIDLLIRGQPRVAELWCTEIEGRWKERESGVGS